MAQREFQVIRENCFMEENWYQNCIYAVFWNDCDIWERQLNVTFTRNHKITQFSKEKKRTLITSSPLLDCIFKFYLLTSISIYEIVRLCTTKYWSLFYPGIENVTVISSTDTKMIESDIPRKWKAIYLMNSKTIGELGCTILLLS